MFHHDQLPTQWCCSVCGLRKPIGQFNTRALLWGETVCHQCIRTSAPHGKPSTSREMLGDYPGSHGNMPSPDQSHPAVD
jgi:hypothetical protein